MAVNFPFNKKPIFIFSWWYWKGEKNKDVVDYMNKHYPNGTSYADFAVQVCFKNRINLHIILVYRR